MRKTVANDVIKARAFAGQYVVFLAWDLIDWTRVPEGSELLGFAIERSEFDDTGAIREQHFLRGIKRFPNGDHDVAPGTPVSTAEHPIQAFQWGDYTVKPGIQYAYRIVPMRGTPQHLTPDDKASLAFDVKTQDEWLGAPSDARRPAHSVHFNRGVAGSQAYARKFGNQRPDENNPDSEQMRWLSRNVFEAITGFIACARDATYRLEGAFYEFHYAPVLQAFRDAVIRGVSVDLLYEAQEYKVVNEKTIADTALADVCTPHRVRSGIRHNKFLVLLQNMKPVAVMTGSTNISAGGIFGHSNVLHIVWDEKVAQAYHDYWTQLKRPDVNTTILKTFSNKMVSTPPGMPLDGCVTLFSPRDANDEATLVWYAERYRSVQNVACMTFAFGLSTRFEQVLKTDDQAVRYALFDKAIKADVADSIATTTNSVVGCGAKLAPDDLECFIGERLTGFNKNAYIHDKFLLCDPLGSNPLVLTGSANFSSASQQANDENMLVIPGDTEVADLYFGEFMRIFDHLYTRYVVGRLRKQGNADPHAGYLKTTPAAWLTPQRDGRKRVRRLAFLA
ncbi:phospholipase D-like domain-containing protein [Massilia cellulosiltytica]|nr:phospholipase D-like domain-containing protein [Telluria cellulosilytica]